MGRARSFLDGLTATLTPPNLRANQVGIASPWQPDSHLTPVVAADIFPGGFDLSSLGVTRDTAMRIAAVARCRNTICGTIAGMPLVALRGSQVLTFEQQSNLITQPEHGRPRAVTLAWTVDQLIWHGRAWWHIIDRYQDGRPAKVRLILEQDVSYDPERGTVTISSAPGAPFPVSHFIRIDALHEGVLSFGRDVLVRAALTEQAAARASNNPVPSVELHQTEGEPLTTAQIDDLVARWAAARSGQNGGIAYTSQSLEARTHGVAAEQLLIAGRNTAALDVARMMGLPAWAVDASVGGSSLTYSNVPSRSRELIDYALQPYMDAIAARLSMDDVLARGQWCRLDPRRLLRGDFTDRMGAGAVAVGAGIYTADEIRGMENEAPLEGI